MTWNFTDMNLGESNVRALFLKTYNFKNKLIYNFILLFKSIFIENNWIIRDDIFVAPPYVKFDEHVYITYVFYEILRFLVCFKTTSLVEK